MRNRARVRGYSGDHHGHRSSRHGRSRSRSRSYSPHYRGRPRSRSYSLARRRRDDYSASPRRRESSPSRQRDDSLCPHGEWSHVAQNLPCVSQKSMKTRGDPILLLVEMVANVMLMILMRRDRHHLTVMDPLHAGGHPGNPQDHLWGHASGPLMCLLPTATD